MKKSIVLLTVVILSLLQVNALFAQRGTASQGGPVNVRLASFMPRNSDWGRRLDRMSAEWARATNNRVNLIVAHDGLEGGEKTTFSSMKSDTIQAVVFTSFGIHNICPSVMTLSAPFLIRSEAELELVFKDAKPLLEAQANKDFVILSWSKGGWVNIFSKEPVVTPDDLRRLKMATNPDDSKLNTTFKAMGFNLVEAEMNDIPLKIANNIVNAFYQTPASVSPLRLYKQLNNMMDIRIAPFLGAIVINKITWNKISPADQASILQITQKTAAELETIMPRMEAEAVANMQKDGLKVNNVGPAQQQLWYDEVQKAIPSLMGNTFDPELYNKISEILRRARSGK